MGGIQSVLWSQCTVVSNNGAYSLNIYLNPVQIVPQQSGCPNGYNFKVIIDYVISASQGYTQGDILALDGELYCYGGTGAGVFPLPLDTASGQVYTTIFSTNSTNCASDTPTDLLCDGFFLHINAKQVSSQYLFCIPAVPLSTSLLSAELTQNNEDLNFEWITATESNTATYLVEHLFDEEDWQVLENIPAQGYSEVKTYYQSQLKNAQVGNHYFKLSEIDLNGDTTFLKLMSFTKSAPSDIQVYPNPSSSGNFTLSASNLIPNSFILCNAQGNLVSDEKFILIHEGNQMKIQLNNLQKGVYYLKDEKGSCYRLIYA